MRIRSRTLIAIAVGALLSAPLTFANSPDPPITLGEKSAFYADGMTADAPEMGITVSGSVAPDVIGSIELPPTIHDVDNHATPADGIDLSDLTDPDSVTSGHIFSRNRNMQGDSREVPRSAERIRWEAATTTDGPLSNGGEFDGIDSS